MSQTLSISCTSTAEKASDHPNTPAGQNADKSRLTDLYFTFLLIGGSLAFWMFASSVGHLSLFELLFHVGNAMGVSMIALLLVRPNETTFIGRHVGSTAFYATTVISGLVIIRPWLLP